MNAYRRLPLTGLSNARELGGYPTESGITKYGVFIRSELPGKITEADIAFLKDYGVTTNIDFRSSIEVERSPDPLRDLDWLEYINLPMFDTAAMRASDFRVEDNPGESFSWGRQYSSMSERNKPWFKAVLEAMASSKGAVLYHCTTGKDRTGIISACLLGICGVSDMDIIADYSVSQIYLHEMYLKMMNIFSGDLSDLRLEDPFFSTHPKNMEEFLEHINSNYKNIQDFLLSCEISPEVIKILKDRLCYDDFRTI